MTERTDERPDDPPGGGTTTVNASAAAQPLRVVIVDDTPDLRDLLRLALESGGFDVVAEAGDGAEAIEVARSLRARRDPARPGDAGDGRPRGAADPPRLCPDAKIVVLSGFGAAQMTRRALAAGADGYLQKGVPLKTILDYVRDLTERRHPAATAVGQGDSPSRPGPSRPGPSWPGRAARTELADAARQPPRPAGRGAARAVRHRRDRRRAGLPRGQRQRRRPTSCWDGPAAPGTPLYATAPELASMVAVHGAEDTAPSRSSSSTGGLTRDAAAHRVASRCSSTSTRGRRRQDLRRAGRHDGPRAARPRRA